MKKILFSFLILGALLIGAIYFYALPKAKQEIVERVTDLGYKDATIEDASINLGGLSIGKIGLDKDGFSYIEDISVKLFWPSYLVHRDIDLIAVGKVQIASLSENWKSLLSYQRGLDLSPLAKISAKKIDIKKIIWDTSSPQGAIRVEVEGIIEKQDNKNIIKAVVHAAQHQLTFDSQWSGEFDVDNNIELEATIDQIGINYAPLALHRGTGWFSYRQNEEAINLSGQLDSGSGKLFNVPINDINLTIGKKDDYYPILFRANASGIKNVSFATDINYSKIQEKNVFDISLNIENLATFISYLKTLKIINSNVVVKPDETNVLLHYLPEKRFADGPLPFDLLVNDDTAKMLQGTFLIYPDSLDIRGTAEGKTDFLTTLQSVFKIAPEDINGDVLRINGNLTGLFSAEN